VPERAQPGLGRKFGAALAATSRQDRATGARTHTKAEAVDLCTTVVVRLEGALAHYVSDHITVHAEQNRKKNCGHVAN